MRFTKGLGEGWVGVGERYVSPLAPQGRQPPSANRFD